MTHIDLCKTRSFEWRNGELFAVSDSVCKDTAWLDGHTVAQMRCPCPEAEVNGRPPKEGEFPFYIIQRLESGDLIFEVDGYVVFQGGDLLCYIKPMPKGN